MVDAGHLETEKILRDMEKEIAKEYKQAEKEVQEKLEKYIRSFTGKNERKLKLVDEGKLSQKEYEEWLYGQMAMGDRWNNLKNVLAEDYTNASQIAKSISFGHMPEVYAVNRNYGTFQVENACGIDTSYTLYDRDSVEHLFKGGRFYPSPGKKLTEKINAGKALAWNKRQIQSVMTQAILQGESIDKIAKRIAVTVGESDRKSDVRNARTMTTCVQNAGRVDSYKRAQDMGIDLMQEWLATLDGRTRHQHRILDGQRVPVGTPFKVEGDEIEYPGDPAAKGYLIYNCRCTLVPALKGFEVNSKDLSLRNTNKLGNMTYAEWENLRPRYDDSKRRSIFKQKLEKQKQAFDKNLEKARDIVKKPLKQIRSEIPIERSKRKKSYYHRAEDVKDRKVFLTPYARPEITAHELFHAIDHKFGITQNKILKEVTEYDWNEMKKRVGSDGIQGYLSRKYPGIVVRGKLKKEYAGLSDIINALTDGDIKMGAIHSKKYWKAPGAKDREIFAEIGAMYYSNNKQVLFVLQNEFPELTAGFEEIMRRL